MPAPRREIGNQPRPTCTICDPVESDMGWRVDALRDALEAARDDGPGSPTDVRRQRRRFEREILAHSPIANPGARRRWLDFVMETHPDLRLPTGRRSVPISGLVLYVLCALVAQILEHGATLPASEREAHFRTGTLVDEIVQLGREALQARRKTRRDLGREGLEGRVVARLLSLEEKLVRIRLRPADLHAAVVAARTRGSIGWVSHEQLLQAARYRRDTRMLCELARPRSKELAQVARGRVALIELLTAAHPSRPRFVRVPSILSQPTESERTHGKQRCGSNAGDSESALYGWPTAPQGNAS
ncbi:MAG TPA: hypothetical protein VGV12_00760 [Gemmatimonadales bacterium]|nr:hypothetical protein [Gemmatimonadales bacterium]